MSCRAPCSVVLVAIASVIATVIGACGDGAAPSCAAIERRLAAIVAADRARAPAGEAARFVPVLDASIVDELGGRCRGGGLTAPARRCLGAARHAADVDRCVARMEAAR